MKKLTFLFSAFAALSMAGSASAQTVINITGATAFREAAHQAIIDSLANLTYGYAGTNVSNAATAIFKGTINGGADQVIVRTAWSGAVAGIRAIVNQANAVTYYATSGSNISLLLAAPGRASYTGTTESTLLNSIAFSDCTQDNTPFGAVSLLGGPVGVIVFCPTVNSTSSLAEGDNITTLQMRRIMQAGSAPLQFITGKVADANTTVYWTGRADTSGTRAIYLSEMGVGASNPVNQWRIEPLNNTTGIAATAIQLWPTGDTTNASTIWGPDTAGNGGYNSGGVLSYALRRTSASVNIKNAAGTVIASAKSIVLLTSISAQDANDIQTGGGKVLAYNNSFVNPLDAPTGFSTADKDKIIKGQYSLWSYEQLYYRDDIVDQPTLDFIALLETEVPNNIAGNGIPIPNMRVSRSSDGGSLTPLPSLL
ncbi:MAG: hypothetical protein WCQ57_11555 [Verrucomicrobiota bacterium]